MKFLPFSMREYQSLINKGIQERMPVHEIILLMRITQE
jgi:hypothetical protein